MIYSDISIMGSFKKVFKPLGLGVIALGMMLPFQNCGGKFESKMSRELSQFSEDALSPENLRFEKAQKVLNDRCVSCHQVGGQAAFSPFTFESENQFAQAQLITPGDPSSSKLIYRLKNYPNTSIPNRNMPTVGTLTPQEYSDLFSWVSMMGATQSGAFTCDPNQSLSQKMIAKNMRRLTRRQYLNTLNDFLSRALSVSTAQSILNSALQNLSLPSDDNTSFSRMDQSVVRQHMRAYFDVADRIAVSVSSSANYSNFVTGMVNLNRGTCTSVNPSSLSAACASRLIENLGLRALRRPLSNSGTSNELTLYTNLFNQAGGGAAGLNTIVFRMLMSPQFLYHIEDQGLQVNGEVHRLSNYEMVSRLSYMLWNSMPDENLFSQAAQRNLNDNLEYSQVVNYVADHQKAQDGMREFMNEWLKLKDVPQFNTGNPGLQFIADGVTLDANLRLAMINEVEELGGFVLNQNLSFQDLFLTDISLARDSRLMSIYGVTQAAPTQPTLNNAVRFPAGQRSGLLTRAALLVGGSELANPIKRGLKVRKDVMCLELQSPPAELEDALEPPAVNINASTRERYDHATSAPACMNCHQYINSLGHAFSGYNSIGKYWTQEPTFTETGAFSGRYVPVNSQVDLGTALSPGLRANDQREFSQLIANQRNTQACVSEKFLKFAEGRPVDVSKEGCRLSNLYTHLNRSHSLKEFVKSIANDAEFRHRRIMGN